MPNRTYPFELPQLTFALDALEPHFDSRTMSIHHGEHHRSYVERLNAVLEHCPALHGMTIENVLRNLSQAPADLRTAVRNNGGGHLNHALFWSLIGVPAKTAPAGPLVKAVTASFGSLEDLRVRFVAAATGHFASGWAFLVADSGTNALEVLALPDQQCVLGRRQTVLLACDLWEHAYYLKHQQKRAEYVDCWWQVVNWTEAARRFDAPWRDAA